MSSEQPLLKQSEGSTLAAAAEASRGPKRRAAESRGCGRGLLTEKLRPQLGGTGASLW